MTSSSPDADGPDRTPGYRRMWPLAVMIVAIAAFWMLDLDDDVSLEAVAGHRVQLQGFVAAHPVLAAVLFVCCYAAAVAVSFPGAALLTAGGGFLFGTLAGGTLAVIAATTGALVIYGVARTSFGEGLARRAGPFLLRFEKGFRSNAFLYLLSLRLAPVFPFWLVNLAPALVGIRLRDHAASTVLGIIPGTFAFAAIGAGLDGVLATRQDAVRACLAAGGHDCKIPLDPSALLTGEVVAAFFALAVVSLIPIAVKALRDRTG